MINTILTLLDAAKLDAFYASGHWSADTIYAAAAKNARSWPEKVAIRERSRSVTYGELIAAADRVAADLHAHGVRAGQRVAVWMPSRIDTAVAVLACSRTGFICCPSLHRDHTTAEVVELLERMRASALIAQAGWGADADRRDIFDSLAGVPTLKRTVRIEPPKGSQRDGLLDPAFGDDAAQAPLRTDPDRVVYLAFTSGTTGVPKGVMHSDNTLLANARALSADWNLLDRAVIYSMSPLSHNLGFGAMVMSLARGSELVVHDLPRGASLVDRLVETGATFVIGVPTHAIDLLAELRVRGLDRLGNVTGFRISGASVPPSVAAELLTFGVVPQSGYGMTEACSHHYTLPDDDPRLITETSGKACSGYEVAIFDRDNPDRMLPPGEVGQIGGRGASLMLGYFDDQAATEQSFNAAGWFMTGDLGWMDENGYLRITGRKKDVIIRGGHNIFPARIEALAMRHASVDKVAVIPVADDRLGERVCLALTTRTGQPLAAEEMLEHLDDAGLSKYDMPEFYVELEQMPLTPSGKILKRELVTWVERGRITLRAVRYKPRSGE